MAGCRRRTERTGRLLSSFQRKVPPSPSGLPPFHSLYFYIRKSYPGSNFSPSCCTTTQGSPVLGTWKKLQSYSPRSWTFSPLHIQVGGVWSPDNSGKNPSTQQFPIIPPWCLLLLSLSYVPTHAYSLSPTVCRNIYMKLQARPNPGTSAATQAAACRRV